LTERQVYEIACKVALETGRLASPSGPFTQLSALEPLMDKCVHCGFCLSTCPSYLLLGQEMDSPRGRIYLQKAGVQDRVSISESFVRHFDTCLGCMACETACPSGVRYAPLIEETRATIERHHRRPLADRLFRWLLFQVLPHPGRLRVLALPIGLADFVKRSPTLDGLLKWLPRRVSNLITLAPTRSGQGPRELTPGVRPTSDPKGRRIGLLTGCVQRVFFGRVNRATANLLAAEGCDVVAPAQQGCCGALALHAGRDDEARAYARALIQVFEDAGVEEVVVNAAGCGSAMKEYGQLLRSDPAWAERAGRFAARVRDASEVLANLERRGARHPIDLKIAYHDACHLAHAQQIRQQPRQLLGEIPGLSVVPLAESEICCGSAGIFNLVEPELASQLGRRKAAHVATSGAQAVVTSNPGCILQLRAALRARGEEIPVFHIMELLEASMEGKSLTQPPAGKQN
jgi:glycolate oxidase iron-sulfur subunit